MERLDLSPQAPRKRWKSFCLPQRQTFVLHAERGTEFIVRSPTPCISIGTVMSPVYDARQRLCTRRTGGETAMNAMSQSDWQPEPQLLAAYFDGELKGADRAEFVRPH